ncbi:uncharacterized protein LOC135233758 isoform X3 [Anguilla rostrata]|uniref:uncharacterized protein LOC135233758 isoform X3 n=1 Tax=Anguilla rostrata TaxID=7938 RepID=UPI0030CBE45B
MLFESEDVVDCVDKKGRCTDFKSLMEDQVSSVVSVSPTALFRTPQHAENTRPRMSNYDQWSSESEGERGLNEFQRKMKREHQQALACVHKACIVVERNRRKRVTCLFPPDDVCRWWLSETHQKKWLSHRQGCMEQKTTCHFRSRKNSSPLNAVHREKLSG